MDACSVLFDLRGNAIDYLEKTADFVREKSDYKWKWVCIALHGALYDFALLATEGTNSAQLLERPPQKTIHEASQHPLLWAHIKKRLAWPDQARPLLPAPRLLETQYTCQEAFHEATKRYAATDEARQRAEAFWKSRRWARNKWIWSILVPPCVIEGCETRERLISFHKAIQRCKSPMHSSGTPLQLDASEECHIRRLSRWRNFFIHHPGISYLAHITDLVGPIAGALRPLERLALDTRAAIHYEAHQQQCIKQAICAIREETYLSNQEA